MIYNLTLYIISNAVLIFSAVYLIQSSIGKNIGSWIKTNPRITIFIMAWFIAIGFSFPVYHWAAPRANTSVLMGYYNNFCGTALTSVGFILFVGIDSRIKTLQKDQLTRAKAQQPYDEMQKCFDILELYGEKYGCEMKSKQINHRRNGTKVAYALEKLGRLSLEISEATNASFINLSHANLQECRIRNLNLSHSKFVNSDLKGSCFENVRLFKADFCFADLGGSNLTRKKLDECESVYNEHTLFE
jgi:Pentapeptide repeats (9 copies)